MSQTNVIITSGSGNQIIHVPVGGGGGNKSSTNHRSATPIEIVTSSSAHITINRTTNRLSGDNNNQTGWQQRNNGNNNNNTISNTNVQYLSTNRSLQSSSYTTNSRRANNNNTGHRDVYNSEDNSEVKALYVNRESSDSREQLLLPSETYIKQEDIDAEEFEEYEDAIDNEGDFQNMVYSKTQYKCSGCGKGFCYTGWLDRHKLANPECRNAQAIQASQYIEPENNNNSNNNYSPQFGSSAERIRPSLEGRLQELLVCPNDGCNFKSHWIQSLNKHVSSSCKFVRTTGGRRQSDGITTRRVQQQVCHICSKSFADTDQHILHMKNVHQIKIYYQCSECRINFDNKRDSESHIQEHHRMGLYSVKENIVSTPIRSKAAADANGLTNGGGGGGTQQYWKCELCNKSYLSLRSFEIHRTSCEKEMQASFHINDHSSAASSQSSSQRNIQRKTPSPLKYTNSPTQSQTSDPAVGANQTAVKHFKRQQIEAIHDNNDFSCRYCSKHFDNSYALCNHLSRRPDCRDWYLKNMTLELKKTNSEHLIRPTKRGASRYVLNSVNNHHFRTNNNNNNNHHNINDPAFVIPRRRRPKPGMGRHKTYLSSLNPWTNSARCQRCRKVFVGKNPTVALTNHLRGSTCVPAKAFQKPEVVRSRTLNKTIKPPPHRMANSIGKSTNKSVAENRFYCKLCPRIELKNRISLGCHLTIYHGLPQVNVTTSKGDGFRCQNCSQIFESKYFYNIHRTDCDLNSSYVGIVSANENVTTNTTDSQNKLTTTTITTATEAATVADTDSGIYCHLCGKTGFSNKNLLNIHLKYQCVKRRQQPNIGLGKQQLPNRELQQKLIVKQPIQMANHGNEKDNKTDANLTMCDSCGRGPYNSFYYFMEHKKKYCTALKDNNNGASVKNNVRLVGQPNRAKKSFPDLLANNNRPSNKTNNELFCLNPTLPRARKTMSYPNVNSPQVSHESSVPAMDTNNNNNGITNNDSDHDVIITVSEITKCTVCSEDFDDVLLFIRHRLSHITQDIMQSESIDAIDCELCGARVHHYQRIQQHLILHLQNVQILKKKNLIEVTKKSLESKEDDDYSDEEDPEEGDQLHCPYCKAEYVSRLELANHIKSTCPFRYQCSNCNNTYLDKASYLEHRDECNRNAAINRIASKAPKFKCRNCGLEFRIKQQLLWHEHACGKVYTSDHSARVEEVIERTLSCSVCGLVSDIYESKVRHESQCLNKYLAVIGNSTEEIKSNNPIISKPISELDFDLTSLSNISQSSEVPEALINDLKEEFGIRKDVKVIINAFDEEIVRKMKTELYCERDESIQLEALKESFMALVRRLIKNDELLREMSSEESNAELVLSRMLRYLGEEAIEHNGLNELNCFRQNLQTFLKLTIKDDTLILAYRDAESVDEAIINMLNFECELHC